MLITIYEFCHLFTFCVYDKIINLSIFLFSNGKVKSVYKFKYKSLKLIKNNKQVKYN